MAKMIPMRREEAVKVSSAQSGKKGTSEAVH